MNRLLSLFLVISFSLALYNCDSTIVKEKGNGNIISRQYDLSGFNEVKVGGNYELFLNEGPSFEVSIVTDENLFDFIEVKVDDERLVIDNKETIMSKDGIKIYLTMPELSALLCGGATVIEGKSPFKSENLEIELTGAGTINLTVDVKKLEVKLSGAGVVNLQGKAQTQQIKLSGVGNYSASDLVSQDCSIKVTGMGGAQVNARRTLQAEISGAGAVVYQGNPENIEKKISGVGTVRSSTEDNGKPENTENKDYPNI